MRWLMLTYLRRPVVAAGVVAVVVVAALAAIVVPRVFGNGPSQTFVARFAEVPGLYPGNAVNILGVKSGTVTKVTPHDGYVEVRLRLPKKVRIPASARAVLMAPNPVSDRTVELFPPYTSGPVMPDGTVIPMSRTVAPLSIDGIFTNIDRLAKALGPSGVNSDGSLSAVIDQLARLTNGNGDDLQNTLAALAAALPAFAGKPGQLSDLIISLDKLTSLLAQHDATIDAVFTDVTRATSQLADEKDVLAAAIDNLQKGLEQAAAFLRTNRSTISSMVGRLTTTSQALISDQQSLNTTFRTAALGFENVNRTIDVNAPCVAGESGSHCPVAFSRLVFAQGVASTVSTYCPTIQDVSLRIAVHSVPGLADLAIPGIDAVQKPTTIDALCVSAYSMTQGHSATPGAPKAPDLGLARFLK
jgi:phospholipid/cholesterol/gamma-HCH transport system substrate-binding protein